MQWIYPLICFILFGEGVMPEIVLEQQEKVVTVLIGGISTLKCSMTGGHMHSYYMYWYRKNQDNTLTFICDENFCDMENFQSEIDSANNKFTLKIIKPSVRDNGIYYCAAHEYWGILEALIFGKGTHLEVVPELQEPSTPSVFVMKNGTNVACLVKDFYPKPVDIHLDPDNNTTEGVVTTANGKFSAVKLGQYKKDLEQIKCTVRHNNKTVEASYKKSHEDSTDKSSDLEEPIGQPSSSQECLKSTVQIEKVNLLSITLLGLRVLLAKSIAVNFFLTIKCFLL